MPKVLMASAGTGGHIYPALAVADFLSKREVEIFFITSDRGEGEIIREKGYRCLELPYRGLHRRICFDNVKRIFKVFLAVLRCYMFIKCYKPDVVVGMGGYGEVPPILAAKLVKVPTLIHEQDVKPGLSTRLLAPLVDVITLSYGETAAFLKESLRKKCVVTGNPVRKDILNIALKGSEGERKFQNKKVLLAFGGSLGAKRINDAVLELLEASCDHVMRDWRIILITGRDDFSRVKERLDLMGNSFDIEILPYMEDMASVYSVCDLVLCRAGASTVAELMVLGLPAILVPYPHSTGNHQLFNARLMEKEGRAIVIRDEDLTGLKLSELLKLKFERKPPKVTDSAKVIGEVILNLVRH